MSDLRQRIELARDNLRAGRFTNEASISFGIVAPILGALGWKTDDPTQLSPEYRVGKRRVDFALLINGAPSVFLEVKQPGLADGADKQLFEYAFIEGVPLAVLTDGATWSIYVPSEQGSYEDRRAYHLDLAERTPSESAERLERYLARAAVASGDAVTRARRDCQHAKQRKGALAATPQAWANLVAAGDDTLLGLLASEVETASGFQPEADDLRAFLGSLTPTAGALPKPKKRRSTPSSVAQTKPVVVKESNAETPDSTGLPRRGYQFSGQAFVPTSRVVEALQAVLRTLGERDRGFLPTLAERYRGKKRPHIAASQESLYPGRPDLGKFARELGQGYWLGTNNNTPTKRQILALAAEVAGITLGEDLSVRFEK